MLDGLHTVTTRSLVSSTGRRMSVLIGILTCIAGTPIGYAQSAGLSDLGQEFLDEFGDPTAGDVRPQPKKSPPEPVDLSYLEDKVKVNEYDIVDLHVNNEDLGNVLQLLSLQSQRNIVASNNVSATVTADLYNVTFKEALDAILHVNGFGYVEKGNFIYVYTAEELMKITDGQRKRITSTINLDYLSAADAAAFVQPLLSPDGKITANAQTSSFSIGQNAPVGADEYALSALLVVFDYEENVQQIRDLIDLLDTKPVQVLVEATILQTSLNENNAFGVDFSIINNMDFEDFVGAGPLGVVDNLISGVGNTMSGGAKTPTTVPIRGNGSGLNTNVGNVRDAGGLKAGIVNEDVAVFLRLLDEVTDVTVVSNPKILTLNRMPARVLVGTKVGYLNTTSTETATTQTVEFLDTGTQLNLRPFVSADGLIRMELKPQVSSFRLRDATDATGATVTIPDEDTSELTTNVMVRDGQTIVLGGLFTETTTANRRQVPGLGDIPIIGNAFRGRDDETRRSEIIFMITPSIVNDTQMAEAGDRAKDHVAGARTGARQGTLVWGRDRRVGQLLIAAKKAAESGDRELALFKVRNALSLQPQNVEARRMLDQLSDPKIYPSGSMLEDVFNHELDLPPASAGASGFTFGSNARFSASTGVSSVTTTDWLLADQVGEISTTEYNARSSAAPSPNTTGQGYTALTPNEVELRQQATQVFGPEAVWLPGEARWADEDETIGSGVNSAPGPFTDAGADSSTEPEFDEFAALGPAEGVSTDSDESTSPDNTSGEANVDSTYFDDWGTNPFASADEIPVFFPMHGGLVWIAIPRGMFNLNDLDNMFPNSTFTNVPTDPND
ncbi:MAG: hypothetical protein KJZ65_10280 [Phycisphaerales bacterium]|nr:hypothetical protein [Phycisphaerales bacterium]